MNASYPLFTEVSPWHLDTTLWIAMVFSLVFHGWWIGFFEANEPVFDLSLEGASSQQVMSISLGRFGAPTANPRDVNPKASVISSALDQMAAPLDQPVSDFAPKAPAVAKPAAKPKPATKTDLTAVVAQPLDDSAVTEPDNPPETQVQAGDALSADQQAHTQTQSLESFVRKNPSFSRPPIAPSYPRLAIKRRWQGEVLVQALVSALGETEKVRLKRSSGFELLDKSALAAVKHWQFQAYVEQGRSVASWVEVPVDFTLR